MIGWTRDDLLTHEEMSALAERRDHYAMAVFLGLGKTPFETLYVYRAFKDVINQMIVANLGLIPKYATPMILSSVSCDYDDRFQWCVLGIKRAAEKWNPIYKEGKIRFSTYAVWWIRSFMVRSAKVESNTIKVPVHAQIDGHKPIYIESTDQIPDEFFEFGFAEETPYYAYSDTTPFDEINEQDIIDKFHKIIPAGKNRDIFCQRYGVGEGGDKRTLISIANEHELSKERVRQICSEVRRKLLGRRGYFNE